MAPEGWLKTTLKTLIDIKHGFAFKSEYFSDCGPHILMTPGHFHEEGGFRCQGSKTKYFTGEVPAGYLLKKGDVVIAMTEQAAGLLGSTALVPDGNKYLHNQRLGLIKSLDTSKIDVNFLYWLYNFKDIRKQISEQASGTKVKHTSPERLTGVLALIPPIEEQKIISELLFAWDKAINATSNLISNSKLQKAALMQLLLTEKRRLPAFKGDWTKYKFGTLFKERVETDSIDLPLLSITSDDGVIYREDVGRKDTSNADKSKYLRICIGDIGYNTMRMWQGVSGLAKFEGIVSPAYTVLIPQKEIDSIYASYLFKLPSVIHLFYRHSQGMVSDTWNLKYSNFAKIKWSIPDINEQKAIASLLSTADQEINALQRKLSNLKKEKSSLMQKLLTGKIRVNTEIQ
ncbi:restriction endonuclease subunit S [Pseudomonas zeae]|uniref:Restriction endonuclease subunit S n=1 Tax=Pseudomonas zeae TaxID=2745510 RepID=A0A9E6NQ17_9PSED|nr:restriction endonuclease subunit S [Pseudomonas zeae]QXI12205.1 restriction endonuclease subunit S [Pseudomonas zeae]